MLLRRPGQTATRITFAWDADGAAAVDVDSLVTKVAFAERLGVTRRALYDLLDGKSAITPKMALARSLVIERRLMNKSSHIRKFMSSIPARRNPNRCPSHPGALLAEALDAIGETKTHIAEHLAISRRHLNDILLGQKPISANVAVRIGRLIGNGPELWLSMQATHDLWHAARAVDLESIPTLKAKAA